LKRLEVRPVAKYCVPCLMKLRKVKYRYVGSALNYNHFDRHLTLLLAFLPQSPGFRISFLWEVDPDGPLHAHDLFLYLGVMLAFFITLTRDAKRAIEGYQNHAGLRKPIPSRRSSIAAWRTLSGRSGQGKDPLRGDFEKRPVEDRSLFQAFGDLLKEGIKKRPLLAGKGSLIDLRNVTFSSARQNFTIG